MKVHTENGSIFHKIRHSYKNCPRANNYNVYFKHSYPNFPLWNKRAIMLE